MIAYGRPFVVGQVYRRQKDIHDRFSGQRQGGIATPANFPVIFLFTGEAGNAYGYEDSFRADGTFWYSGEGQVGDMRLTRGNAAIANHQADKKLVLFYENVGKGLVRFLGEVDCLGHHAEQRPDRNGKFREVIIFHLGFRVPISQGVVEQTAAVYEAGSRLPKNLTLDELRYLALRSASTGASVEIKRANVARRAEAIRRYALKRASGICEGCVTHAPFMTKQGPFLEVHHVFRLTDGGPDHPACVIALCPNCHRRAHHSVDKSAFNQILIRWLEEHEPGDRAK